MEPLPPDDGAQLALAVVISTLLLLLLVGVVVLLMVVNHNRRNRHLAQLAEERAHHAEEVRKVEKEVLQQTLAEVGTELHDNIGQMLMASRMGVMNLQSIDAAAHKATEARASIEATIAEVRRLSRTLDPDRMNGVTLKEAIGRECERLGKLGTLEIVFPTSGDGREMGADEKLVLYRIFQEVTHNTVKHAKATRLDVSLDESEGVSLTIRDNGTGFDVAAALNAASGQGLKNIHRRASLIGYHCEVTSVPGVGTTTIVWK